MSSGKRRYSSDLSDIEWECIRQWIPRARSGGRPRTTDVRLVLNAIFYVNRTGCAWRYLPSEFPPWQTVYDYFWKWSRIGFWTWICRKFAILVREKYKKSALPHLGIFDSQSVRAHYGEQKGWDGYKKVRGRKRHILVDSLGIVWLCKAHSATDADEPAAIEMLKSLPEKVLDSLKLIIADGAYRRRLPEFCKTHYQIEVQTISARKIKNSKIETNIKPKRWIVERTFAWFNLARRLSRDFEKKTIYSEAMVYIAMVAILLKRLRAPIVDFIRELFRQAP